MNRILIIEDDPIQRLTLGSLIGKRLGFPVEYAANGQEGLEKVAAHEDLSLVLMDLSMPVMGGKQALQEIRVLRPRLPVIITTASDEMQDVVETMRLGAQDFLTKPIEPQRLIVSVENALRIQDLSHEVERLKREKRGEVQFSDLVGSGGGLSASVELGRKAASSDIPVLITGESGVGKELFSRAVHGESNRRAHPFIAVNCGAIPAGLIESVLFGHEKGAFTGAVSREIGKFREAEGGTIFLDEVGDLPPKAQVALLRALQEKEIEPVGQGRPVKVNVRIVSATNRNLAKLVNEGAFREDLFFRLNVFPIEIPPLRARRNDIPALAEQILRKVASAEGRPVYGLSEDALSRLSAYGWPGNIRELQNVLFRAVLMCEEGTITAAHLGEFERVPQKPEMGLAFGGIDYSASGAISLFDRSGSPRTLESLELEAIDRLMTYFNQDVKQVAKALGLGISTVYKRLEKRKREQAA